MQDIGIQHACIAALDEQFHLEAEHIEAGGHKVTQHIQRQRSHKAALRQAQLHKHNRIAGQRTAGDGLPALHQVTDDVSGGSIDPRSLGADGIGGGAS